jgi:hypothetical protein
MVRDWVAARCGGVNLNWIRPTSNDVAIVEYRDPHGCAAMRKEREQRLQVLRSALNDAAADPVRFSGAEAREHFDRLLVEAEKKSTR